MNQGSKWGVLGAAFVSIALGIFLFWNPRTDLLAISWLLALVLISNGISGLFFYKGLPSQAQSIWLPMIVGVECLLGSYLFVGTFLGFPLLVPILLGSWIGLLAIIRLVESAGMCKEVPILSNYLFWSSLLGLVLGFFLINHAMVGGGVTARLVASTFVYSGLVQLMKVLNN
ncbi:DUF308 domain-containing protein [Streptococcus danieliae]|uniref:DUF308 domain-containing protein n=1 Tax=Streptococcus danieliae TaxID=747656 RepID=UPI00136679B1